MGKNKKPIEFFIITIVILVIAIIAILVYNIIINKNYTDENKEVIDSSTGEKVTGELLKLYQMEETERIKYYFNNYIDALQNGDYEICYNMLDDKFKNNYYKTIDEFKNYVQKKYSPIISVTYDDLLRMGNYYILDITFLDLFSSTNDNIVGQKQKFIIYETDYNEYKIAFQAE